MPPDEKEPGLQSVQRATAVLEVIARYAEEGCRLADVIRETELGKATAHRFLRALEALGLVEADEASGRYFIGMRLVALGTAAGNRFGLIRRARPSLRRLAEVTADTVYLSFRAGNHAVCIAREEGAFPIKTLTLGVGSRRPLGIGAAALAMLAYLPDAEIDRLLGVNEGEIREFGMDRATMWEMVEASRRCGYALNNGRFVQGMSAVALPITNGDGHHLASIAVAAIDSRMTSERRETIVHWIGEEVAKIEAALAPICQPRTRGPATEEERSGRPGRLPARSRQSGTG